MAATITDSPNDPTLKGQRLIITCEEDVPANLLKTGYRFVVTVTPYIGGAAGDDYVFYVQPNPDSSGIIDVQNLLDKISYVDDTTQLNSDVSVHVLQSSTAYALNANNYHTVDIAVTNGWDVDGNFTEDPDNEGGGSPQDTASFAVFAGAFQPKDGYKPALSEIQYAVNTAYILSKRRWNEWRLAATYSITSSSTVSIPVFDTDWGVLTLLNDGSWDTVEYRIFDGDGTQLGTTSLLSNPPGSNDFNMLCYYMAYPKTLDNNAFLGGLNITPSDFDDDWAYYTIIFRNGLSAVSSTFVFYRVCDARYTPIRIAWANSLGGWDYHNFRAKSTPSYRAERKRYKRVLGNFGTSYTQNSWDRGQTDFGRSVSRYIEVTEPNMTPEKYEYFVDLFRSDNIQIIPNTDDPQIEGLILENTEYLEEQLIRAESPELTFRFRYANDLL